MYKRHPLVLSFFFFLFRARCPVTYLALHTPLSNPPNPISIFALLSTHYSCSLVVVPSPFFDLLLSSYKCQKLIPLKFSLRALAERES